MKRYLFVLFILVFASVAQAEVPKVLSDFFGHNGVQGKASVYYGEMLHRYAEQRTLGEGLPPNVIASFRKIDDKINRRVYAVLLSDENQTQDWYAFLVKENGIWKLNAVRNLALGGVPYEALHYLEGKIFRTVEEEWHYQNLLLTIKSDSALKAYFQAKTIEFNKVVALFVSGKTDQAESLAKSLFISFVRSEGPLIELNIGGIIDNSVGYLYVPPGMDPPTMTPAEYIYLEELAKGWYIYKTT